MDTARIAESDAGAQISKRIVVSGVEHLQDLEFGHLCRVGKRLGATHIERYVEINF